jgi:hydroxylaminobenzene mutase
MEGNTAQQNRTAHRLLQLGVLLFLLGLLSGIVTPALANPRMGLSSHLEGVMNGTFLLILGVVWPKLVLSRRILALTYWLAIYGTFANWAATGLAAVWGAGASSMPIAALRHQGTTVQEAVIHFLLVSLSVAMVAVCVLVLWGLRKTRLEQVAVPGPAPDRGRPAGVARPEDVADGPDK